MSEDYNNIAVPMDWVPEDSIIKVIGVGGGGCNAVAYMYNQHIKGCTFIVCNTDKQVLEKNPVPVKVQMGQGLGAGTDPLKGRNCAIESASEIEEKVLNGTKMLFITAGMGGGTGTGAAPVIAKMAKDKGILTVAVVTLPFKNELNGSYSKAVDGIRELQQNVDSLLIINNEKLFELYGQLLMQDAFPKADEVLATAVRGITEIISSPGYINVDFNDVQAMMRDSGMALMGCGTGTGENRLEDAVRGALESPLLKDFDLATSKNALINITAGYNEKGLLMSELQKIDSMIAEATGKANKFKRGIVYDYSPECGDKISITVIATGFKMSLLDGVIGSNEGNVIFIDENYEYRPFQAGEEIELDDYTIDKIGYNRSGDTRRFSYAEAPDLVNENSDMDRLNRETAFKRATRRLANKNNQE